MKRYFFALILSLLMASCAEQKPIEGYSWEEDLHERLLVDFNRSEQQIKDYISRYIPDVSYPLYSQPQRQVPHTCSQRDTA